MQSQWQWLLWARGKSWKNTWESRKGAVLGNQEEFLLEMSGILKFIIPQPTPVPAWLWEHTSTGKTEVFHPKFPKKKTKPLLYNPSGTEAFVIYNFPCIPSPHLVKYSLTPPQVRHKPRVFPYLTGPLIPAPSF